MFIVKDPYTHSIYLVNSDGGVVEKRVFNTYQDFFLEIGAARELASEYGFKIARISIHNLPEAVASKFTSNIVWYELERID